VPISSDKGDSLKYRVTDIHIPVIDDDDSIYRRVAERLKVDQRSILSLRIVKESIDARNKNYICKVYTVIAEIDTIVKEPLSAGVSAVVTSETVPVIRGTEIVRGRPVVVGTGPAGLFAGLTLAVYGYSPLLIERGGALDQRIIDVDNYWHNGVLNPESNVQFGEGGAGTFSDGKLTTRISDPLCESVLKVFIESGLDEQIIYQAKPHIGTDKLRIFLQYIRKRITDLGGSFLFNTRLDSLASENNELRSITLSNGESIDTNALILAIGHSARDTFRMLKTSGIAMEQKPFSMGVRIEHLQSEVDRGQYGRFAGHPKLKSAEYSFFCKIGNRTVYTFCMCPGGTVVAAASMPDTIVTNGMSEYLRDRINANSGFVVSVDTNDFQSNDPLAGIELQNSLERAAFRSVGGQAPVQRLKDFMDKNVSKSFGRILPSYTGSTGFADLNTVLPGFIAEPIHSAVGIFGSKLPFFYNPDAVLTGVETRTSSPVRILRDDTFQSITHRGLFPCGEGAGFAGGIMSAAVDGIRTANALITIFKAP